MPNKNFAKFFFCFYTAIFIAGMVNVYAAPAVTVVSPNGGEVWNGTNTIQWTASDSGNSQNLLANLYYSSSAGAKNNEIADVNLMTSCDFSTDSFIWDFNAELIAGLPNNFTLNGKPFFFEINNTLYGLVNVSTPNRILGYSFTGSGWIPNYDINADINAAINPPMAIFTIGASTCYLATNYSGYCWNSSNWIPNFDVNDGNFFGVSGATSFMYGGTPHLLRFGGYGLTGSDWNGDGWNYNNIWATDANSDTVGSFDYLDIRNLDGQLILLKNRLTGVNTQPVHFPAKIWNGGKWVIYPDYNKNLETLSSIQTQNFSKYVGFTFENKYYLISQDQNAAGQVDWNAFNSTRNGINTKTPTNCTYSWDTTTALNSNFFLDINVSNGVTQTIDSSNGVFTISNLTADDINISCIENCTVQGFDGNAIVLNPIDESLQIKFYAQNNEIAKSFFIKINNSLKDGKRYFVYTSTPNDSDANYSFDNSLTFGSSTIFTDSIQKIYDGSNFVYTMTEPNLTGGHNKYYLLKYQAPVKQWSAIGNSSEWNKRLLPVTKDLNDLTVDLFQTSSYAFMQNELIEKIPTTTSVPAKNLIFLFTGKALTGSNTIYAGQVATSGATAANSATINSTERTYDFQSSAGGFLSQKTPATVSTLKIYDYAIVPGGLFLKNVSVTDLQGNGLPAIIVSGRSWQYLSEEQKYKVNSQLYDQDGTLTKVEVFVYLETVADANLVSYSVFDYVGATVAGQTHDLSLEMPGIIDFTANNKKMLVKIRATAGGYSEISSEWLEFVQFPYYPGDFSIKSYTPNLIVGQSPQTTVKIRNILPNTLRGINYYIFSDLNSPDHSDYNKTFYAEKDFSCNGFDCSFNINISDWVVPNDGRWNIVVSALLTTQNEDWNSSMTAFKETFFTKFKEIEAARLFEAIERNDHIYRNDEPITLVLQLRDKDLGNLKNSLEIKLQISACGAKTGTSDCNVQDKNYLPDQYVYQPNSGINYWFWRTIFTDANGALMADGLYYRFKAILTDTKSQHEGALFPVLTTKCQPGGYNSDYQSASLTNLLDSNYGCNWPTPKIVSTDVNTFESRILINAEKDLNVPSFPGLQCLINDLENLYEKQMEQSVICFANYSYNETNIDNFKFYIANQNSDFSKTGANKQYIEIVIPYSVIILNDIGSLKQKYFSEYSKTSLTLGQAIVYTLKKTDSFITSLIGFKPSDVLAILTGDKNTDAIEAYFVKSYQQDLNYGVFIGSGAGFVEGIIPIEIKGIPIINIQSYISQYPDLEKINAADFVEYMNFKGRALTIPQTTYTVFKGSLNDVWVTGAVSSPIIVNEIYDKTNLTLKKQIDKNLTANEVPTILELSAIADITYNINSAIRRSLVLTYSLLPEELGADNSEISNFLNDLSQITKNPLSWLFNSAWWLFIVLVVVFVVSMAWANFKNGGGNITINSLMQRR